MSKSVSPSHPGTYVKENVIPKGVSVKKAAEMMGIGRPALSNYLNGKANLSMNMATRLEKTFGVNKKDLLALQQEYDSFINREEERSIAVKSYTPSFLKITATHIEAWADRIEARSLLAVLIRRLVNTTSEEIVVSNFPAYDKSQTPGWDGTVESNNVTPWIPSGVSGWEFGCNNIPKTKADGDYKSRTEAIPESERKEITFVFVTPRNWPKKDDWIKTARAKNEWKDIRAFDANDIEQWLELSVSAQVWMAEQLGLPANECQTLNQYWLYWSQTATPAISPKIFNSAISDYGKKVKDWYQSNPDNPLVLTAASKEEAKAFLCCIVEQVEGLQPLIDQAIFVSSPETMKRLSEISTDFIPIAYTDEAQQELVVSFKKRRSIVITERKVHGMESDICLDLPNFETFKEALNDMGFNDAQIDVYANQTGNSPTILRRQLAKIPALRKPVWATLSERRRTMVPLVLAGTWSTNQEADKEILSCLCLANESYPKIEREIAELTSMDDSPIWSEGKYRGVISGLDCFYAISDQLTEEDIENFFDLAEYVLSEDDPAFDLEKENRWAANIYNKVRDHSAAIRQSLCQNLTILAVHGNGLFGQRLGIDIKNRVSHLICILLKNKDSRVWQTQQQDLPKYAEAAPDMFLSIVEEELQKDAPAFKVLFEPVGRGVFSRCERTGMLWALELLAWNPSLLARIVKVLGTLSTYDLNDNWVNRPINSLKDILLMWKPHTAASVEQRCEVLGLLCKQYPEIGWEMCILTLKPGRIFTSGTYRPSWRSDASGAGNMVSPEEARQYGLKCLELVLSWPSHSAKTLKGLVSCLPSMEDGDKKKVIEQVRAWVANSPKDEDLIDLREHVRTRTMTTRALINNKKKNNDHVNGKELYEMLEPKDPLLKHQWLFTKGWVEYTPEDLEEDDLDYQAREKGLAKQRVAALNEVIAEFGVQGIIELLKKSGAGFLIGTHLYNDILSKDIISEFILQCLSVDGDHRYEFDSCISGILYQMTESKREALLSDLINQLSSDHGREETISRIFINAPFGRHTWNQLGMQSDKIQNVYWSSIHPGWSDLSSEDINFSINKLLSVDRPLVAFNLAHFKLEMVESECLIKLLHRIASNSPENDSNYKPSEHDIEAALKSLNERNDFDRMELVKLEYIYIDILYLDSSYGIPNLSKDISESPMFFMQLVAYSCKRQDDGKDPIGWELPQDEKARSIAATKAYHVLNCLDLIPGTQKDGSIVVSKLCEWVLQVRKLAKEYGREDTTDRQIGKLFSTSGEGNDGIWPREEIRTVFEEIGSTEISIGMERGLYNSIGFRPVDSPGERATAEKYREMSTKVMNKTPFVGRMLMNIADSYDRNAERWDANHRVNKRLRGW